MLAVIDRVNYHRGKCVDFVQSMVVTIYT